MTRKRQYISNRVHLALVLSLGTLLAVPAVHIPTQAAEKEVASKKAQAPHAQSQVQPQAQMDAVLTHYLKLQESLAKDDHQNVQNDAALLSESAKKLGPDHSKLAKAIQSSAQNLKQSTSLKQARDSFKKLSIPIVEWVQRNKPSGLDVVYCPMAGAKWVQKPGEVMNPYFGKEMLNCGEKVS